MGIFRKKSAKQKTKTRFSTAPPAVAGNAASWFGGQSGSVDAESMSDADLLGLVTDDGGSGAVDGD